MHDPIYCSRINILARACLATFELGLDEDLFEFSEELFRC